MKPKHKRLIIVLVSLVSIFTGTFVLLDTFRDNLIYFYPPKDIATMQTAEPKHFAKILKRQIRVGGMVKEKTYKKTGELDHSFIITDYTSDLKIRYNGILPPMFREGQGVVAQGNLFTEDNKTYFKAEKLITKHDEKYMPPEVERSLKKD